MTYPPDDTQHDDDTLRWSSDDERCAFFFVQGPPSRPVRIDNIVAPVIVERLREAAERSE